MLPVPAITLPEPRLRGANILIIEDVELNQRMLAHILQGYGYKNVHIASCGQEGLERTQALRPDLVLLDLMMPGMDGFEYTSLVRSRREFDDIPILVQTMLDEQEHKVRIFELGATDFVNKPVLPGELIARVKVHLERRYLLEDLRAYRERIGEELEAARAMQDKLMPAQQQASMCERVYDLQIATHFESCSELGGDGFGIKPISDTRLAIYAYDFSGHGITAALNVFRLHTLMHDQFMNGSEPGSFLNLLNHHLLRLLEPGQFATMFYGVIDTESNCLQYATAAAPPPMLIANSPREVLPLSGRGFPLGVVAKAEYETKYSPFMPGQTLFLYSDALIETPNARNDFFNEQRLMEYLMNDEPINGRRTARSALEQLIAHFRAHAGGPLRDDLTLGVYHRRGR